MLVLFFILSREDDVHGKKFCMHAWNTREKMV